MGLFALTAIVTGTQKRSNLFRDVIWWRHLMISVLLVTQSTMTESYVSLQEQKLTAGEKGPFCRQRCCLARKSFFLFSVGFRLIHFARANLQSWAAAWLHDRAFFIRNPTELISPAIPTPSPRVYLSSLFRMSSNGVLNFFCYVASEYICSVLGWAGFVIKAMAHCVRWRAALAIFYSWCSDVSMRLYISSIRVLRYKLGHVTCAYERIVPADVPL